MSGFRPVWKLIWLCVPDQSYEQFSGSDETLCIQALSGFRKLRSLLYPQKQSVMLICRGLKTAGNYHPSISRERKVTIKRVSEIKPFMEKKET